MTGGGSDNSTTRIEPPKYQLPYLETGLKEAQGQYNTDINRGTVATPSQDTMMGQNLTSRRALTGSPITQYADDLASNTLAGGSLNLNPYASSLNDYANGQQSPYASSLNQFIGQQNPYTTQFSQFTEGGDNYRNPYLDQTFSRAALGTQNQLASEFARSGRNVDASEGLRSQQLNDLATGIYGGAYENDRNRSLAAMQSQLGSVDASQARGLQAGMAQLGSSDQRAGLGLQARGMQLGNFNDERNRQQQVLGMSGQLAQNDYADYDRLLGVGQQRDTYAQQLVDAPGRTLDQFLSRVSGNFGQTQITPNSQNRAAGALGGGMLGAQFGGSLSNGNPWAQGIGGLLGGYLGGWG